jgi:transposase
MIQVEDREVIRRAYFDEHKSIRAIAKELGHGRDTVAAALVAEPVIPQYSLTTPRAAPKLGEHKARIEQLLAENATRPRKQRYTTHKIYEALLPQGYAGSEVSVRRYVAHLRKVEAKREVYLPLEFDPGQDAQVDWGEAEVVLAGERVTAQLFVLRLCYSRKLFVRAYPTQRQEAFFDGHVAAFHYLGGIPRRLTYDNLSTAVLRVLQGRNRAEQQAFIAFRSYYLFDSRFCTPGQGHEKGGVESGVGFARRNFLVPLPEVGDYEALNALLLAACQADDQRTVDRQPQPIGQMWQAERAQLRPLPAHDFACCVTRPVALNAYSQVEFETNRYSVPVEVAYRQLLLKAYPFRIDILHQDQVVAVHRRSYGHKEDVYEPLHYLPLLEQRPGAFEHARPLRQWRSQWPHVYEQLLAHLRAHQPEGEAIPEFVRILGLQRDYPVALMEQAISAALAHGGAHLEGIRLRLRQLQQPDTSPAPLDLSTRPHLAALGQAPVNLRQYEALLEGGRPHLPRTAGAG